MQKVSLTHPFSFYRLILPGLLLAATGVGAGDLLTAGFAGMETGLVLLWAVALGAIIKFTLTEAMIRRQLASGLNPLQDWSGNLGDWIRPVFLTYIIFWSFFTGGALISACGVAGHALLPLFENAELSRACWGLSHSLIALLLIRARKFGLFEKVMSFCVVGLFGIVVVGAALIRPDPGEILSGLFLPRLPAAARGTLWAPAVIGGVGGTLTLLSYGYWVEQEGRRGLAGLRTSRIDLAISYSLTAIFGMAMLVICAGLTENGPLQANFQANKSNFAYIVAERLKRTLGNGGAIFFLLGFWAAVFSSLLGVWQSIPPIFARFQVNESFREDARDYSETKINRTQNIFLVCLAVLPALNLLLPLKTVQLVYSIFGSLFLPLLASILLILGNRKPVEAEGLKFQNGLLSNGLLVLTLLFFGGFTMYTIVKKISSLL